MPVTDGFPGRDVDLFWDGATIPGVREKGVTMNGEAIDVGSDDDAGWRKLLDVAGENQVDLSLSGVTKSKTLKAAWFSGARTKSARLEYPDGGVVVGTFYLASFTETGTYNEAMTFEATLQSTGPVSYLPYE